MSFYCERCKRLSETEKECYCGKKKLRNVRNDDYCFLLEADESFGKMLKDCFENNGIECALSPSGDGYRSALGMSLGKFLIYVLYSKLDEAKEIVQFFRHDRTAEFKEDIINHKELWFVAKGTKKRLCKKLKLKDECCIFDKVQEIVEGAKSISDEGIITTCPEFGHYLLVKADELEIWFNSATYEIYL